MYGTAFDLGTTTVVGYLCNLETGKVTGTLSESNAQIECGLDVLSRVSFRNASKENALKLASLLGDQVCRMANELISGIKSGVTDAGKSPLKAVLVGNPVIMGSVADYDFESAGIEAVRIPGIGHYVGADALAASYVTEKDRKGRNIVIVDIGTNTEIILLSNGKKTATSAAAGPAMEGGNLVCGMRGEEGAIEFVKLTDAVSQNRDIIFKVIGDVAPTGICGSGYFFLLKALLEAGVINNDGYLISKEEALRANVPGRIVARIHENNDSDPASEKGRFFALTESIAIYREDIRNLQLAISAIKTGIDIVINEAGLTESVIDNVFIAGAFGNKISVDSLTAVGMLPGTLYDKAIRVGNIAGLGACLFMFDEVKITDAINLKKEILTVSLADHPDFQRLFMENMNFNII
ncbi:MAG: ASKHA domain-containing protein [Lachnospiraceae bacterium]|nr:ASKHA domain-containing protein [Lachnospiraceae bacterium]